MNPTTRPFLQTDRDGLGGWVQSLDPVLVHMDSKNGPLVGCNKISGDIF